MFRAFLMNITIEDISFQEVIIQNWIVFFVILFNFLTPLQVSDKEFGIRIVTGKSQFQDKDLLVYSV